MFPCHVTSLNMFLVERRFHFGLLVVHVPMLLSLPSFMLRVLVLSLCVRFPFIPSLMFPCFDSACILHVLTRSYVYCTPHRTYSYIRTSPVYCRIQD